MTEADVSECIVKWIWYTERGSPDEHDFGDGLPRQYGMSSVERKYFNKNRRDWMTTQERIDEIVAGKYTVDDFQRVEKVYRGFTKVEQLTIWYHRWTPFERIPVNCESTIFRFRAEVAKT
jgi:hypothetical protein